MRRYALTLVAAIGLLAACATEQKPSGTVAESTVEAQATVTAIDLQKRLVTLKAADGEVIVVEASDAVKNLPQVKVGDVVKVTYTEALAWQVKKASAGTPGITETTSAEAASPGEKPGARAGSSVTLTTTITAIDTAKGTVTLTGPEGNSKTIKVKDPTKLKQVQVGDLVDITYSEGLS